MRLGVASISRLDALFVISLLEDTELGMLRLSLSTCCVALRLPDVDNNVIFRGYGLLYGRA